MGKRVLNLLLPLPLVLLFSGNAFFYCIHSHSSRREKRQKNYLSVFIYFKIAKPEKNTCEEAKFLAKLLAYSLEYITLLINKILQFLKNYEILWKYLCVLRNRILHSLHIIVLKVSLEYHKMG